MGGVFINCRGVDSDSYGALLYTDLVRRFGENLVFLATESIRAGDHGWETLARVRSARVVLTVVGPNWLTVTDAAGQRAIDDSSDGIRRELVEAFAAGVRVVPVLIDDAVLPAAADLPRDVAALSQCQARHLRRREPIRDLDRLAAELTVVDPELAAVDDAISESGARPQGVVNRAVGDVSGTLIQASAISGGIHVHLPAPVQGDVPGVGGHVRNLPADTGVFVGRVEELTRLREATAASNRVVVVAVHGLGGVGKSTLVARFAEQHLDEFSPMWWVTADSAAAIGTGLADLAAALNPTWAGLSAEQRTEQAVGWLASHTGWLLILDNLTAPADAESLLARVRTGTILVTSRHSSGWRRIATVSVDVLTPAEAFELLDRIVRSEWPDADLGGADQLCEELGWLPLAVEQASAYIAQNRITPARYLDLLERFPARMFTATAEGGDAQRTMARVWHVTLDQLTDTPLAGELLRRVAWCAPDNIPRALFEWPDQGPEVGEALGRLAAYNMITLTADTISVHRLVQAVSRAPDPTDPHRHPDDIARAHNATAATLAVLLADADYRLPADWPRFQMVLPHALALLDHATADTDTQYDCALASDIGIHLLDQGDTNTAIKLLTRANHSRERLHGPGHPASLNSRHELAYAYGNVGDLGRAIPLLEATLADMEQVLGHDHPGTLAARNNLALNYQMAGDTRRVIPLLETNLADQKRVLGPDHLHTLGTGHNLAFTYKTAGDLGRAIPLFEATLADQERVLGPDHPHTLLSRNNLADAYQTAGDPRRAIQLFETALADHERVLGSDHPDTLLTRKHLADTYKSIGAVDRAVPLLEETLADYERVLGPHHQDTLSVRDSVAGAYQAVGDLGRAIALFEATLADRERVLGPDHPHTLLSRNNVAGAHQAVGDLGRAIPLFKTALADHERVLGSDHLYTLGLRDNLASAYLDAGNVRRAIPLHEATLTDYERILGPDHPQTLLARNTLACAYQTTGNLAQAISLYKETLPDYERVLGPDHPHTLGLRNNLAGAYQAAGDLAKANPLYEATLADAERALEPNHPLTRSIRAHLDTLTNNHDRASD